MIACLAGIFLLFVMAAPAAADEPNAAAGTATMPVAWWDCQNKKHVDRGLTEQWGTVPAWKIVSWPANRSDGYNPKNAANRIPEGLRFRLDPAVNVDALKLHPVGRMIAHAAQKYGFVVWDKAGAITLRAENPKSYTKRGEPDPYPALFGKTPAYALLSGFPWDKLQFLPLDYGKPDRGKPDRGKPAAAAK